MPHKPPTNREIAALMDKVADIMEKQEVNTFRVKAYRSGAKFVRTLDVPLADMVAAGDREGVEALPVIGEGLANLIFEYVRTGQSSLLKRLEGSWSPELMFEKVPGIGKTFAHRIAEKLNIKSLEELEHAAYDGTLASVEGFGERRLEAVRTSLAGMLGARPAERKKQLSRMLKTDDQPTVDVILKIDAEYRRKAKEGRLKTITPKRFNPKKEAWLPVLHTDMDGWSFTALFSNTIRAHLLSKTHDWVVVFYDKKGIEGQCTVVTETSGPLEGKRVVRGREDACLAYYR